MTLRTPNEMLILAGGLGTRLRKVVSNVPKPMAEVNGRPFICYLLDYWIGQGITRFVISTGYLSEIIVDYFGNEYKKAKIEYVHEYQPLGTGGALKNALKAIEWNSDYLIMANGDTWFPVSLTKMCEDAGKTNFPITIALKALENNSRYDSVTINNNGLITNFGIKNHQNCLINGGGYLICISKISKQLEAFPESFSLEKDFMFEFSKLGAIGGSIQNYPFLDIGIPEDYHKATLMMK